MRSLNIGLIGVGNIAITHLTSLSEINSNEVLRKKYNTSLHIKTLIDIEEKKIQLLQKKRAYGAEVFSTSPRDLFDDGDIDVIYISTPTRFHFEHFERAVEAGKHVFVEKPLAFGLSEIKKMIALQKRHDVHVQVGLVLRHCPIFWKLKTIMKEHEDKFGEPLAMIFRDDQEWPISTLAHPSEWRKDPDLARAGCLFEHSIHDVDLIESICGGTLKHLKSNIKYISNLTSGILEDSAMIQMEYAPEIPVSLISIWHNVARDQRRIEFFFERAFVLLDGYEILRFKTFRYQIGRKRKSLKLIDIQKEYALLNGVPDIVPTFGPYFYENLGFLESIIEDVEPQPGLEVGFRAHEIIEAAYESSRKNKIITF
ncbi:MAG: Gfo/Idh/MocA family protein [Candidatus Helarchaeota archaeon]